MVQAQQLDLFSSSEFDYLHKSVEDYKSSADKVRRGVFARLDALKKDHDGRLTKVETDLQELRSILDRFFEVDSSNIIPLRQHAIM